MRTIVSAGSSLALLAAATGAAAAADLGSLRTWDGGVADGQFGIACTVVGDMDGDGFADFAIGASADSTAGTAAGRVFVYRGGPHLGEPPALVLAGLPGELLGAALAPAGDVDGDGLADLLVGAPAGTTVDLAAPGRVLIVFGSVPLGGRAPSSIAGTLPASRFGAAVAGLGPFDGDGFADFAVGAPDANNGAGLVQVFAGSPSGSPAPWFTLHGRAADDNFGYADAGAGRTRGGAYADLLVGAPFNSQSAVWAGRVYLYLGGAVPDTVPDRTFAGEAFGDLFGSSVAGAGDVNGDGRADFVVGAPGANAGQLTDAGKAYLFLGATPPPAAAALAVPGSADYAELGLSATGVGDVDGDGFADWAAGAPGTPDSNTVGGLRFFLGRAVPTATADTVLGGEAGGDQFGRAISGGGLVLGNARAQFLAGSYAHGGAGRAYLLGTTTGVLDAPAPQEAGVALARPWPNPTWREARIAVELDRAAASRLSIVDLGGRSIAVLADQVLGAGRHEFSWPAVAHPRPAPGIYWVVLEARGARWTRRFALLR